MKRQETTKRRIWEVFRYHVFRNRTKQMINEVLSSNFPRSTTRILEEYDDINVERLSETSDKVTLIWDDSSVEMSFIWKPSGTNFVLIGVE